MVKTPKVYIADTGITAVRLGLSDFNQLAGHPVFGSLWESMVIANLKGIFPHAEFSFYRPSNGTEIDILLQLSGKLIAIECKASVAPALSRGSYFAIEIMSNPLHLIALPGAELRRRTDKDVENDQLLLAYMFTHMTLLFVVQATGELHQGKLHVCQKTPPRPCPSLRAVSIETMALFTPRY